MDAFLDYLNKNSGALTLVFTFFVAVATVAYAILTWRLVSETRGLRQAQTEPKIAVSVQPTEEWISLLNLVIENIGLGPAYDVTFRLDGDFEYDAGERLSELNLMRKGTPYLGPGRSMTFFLTSMVEDFDRKINQSFTVHVSRRNALG